VFMRCICNRTLTKTTLYGIACALLVSSCAPQPGSCTRPFCFPSPARQRPRACIHMHSTSICVNMQVSGTILTGVSSWGVKYNARLSEAVPPSSVIPLLIAGVFLMALSLIAFVGGCFNHSVSLVVLLGCCMTSMHELSLMLSCVEMRTWCPARVWNSCYWYYYLPSNWSSSRVSNYGKVLQCLHEASRSQHDHQVDQCDTRGLLLLHEWNCTNRVFMLDCATH
jgi:hypothetical protein